MARKKKPVKPTPKEKKIIRRRLQKKYPQMYERKIGSRLEKQLKGLSPGDRKALEEMVDKKLKKIYRKK